MQNASSDIRRQTKTRIIIVDDDKDVRRSMIIGFGRYGYGIADFSSGAELLSIGDYLSCDIILIDYKLPHMDGLELLRHLKKDGLNCPAYLVTGYFSTSLIHRAKDAGYLDVIEKPLTVSKIVSRIENQ